MNLFKNIDLELCASNINIYKYIKCIQFLTLIQVNPKNLEEYISKKQRK